MTDTAPCGCPRDAGRPGVPGSSVIRHDRDICTDPVVARLGWYADRSWMTRPPPRYITTWPGLATVPSGSADRAATPAEPRPLTRHDISRRYERRVWEAIDRRNELEGRYHSARAEVTLRAQGRWDPEKHGRGGAEPLTAAEHLERIGLDEYISRFYQPHYELDEALKAGATVGQVADALGCREDEARERIRSWAEGQHAMWAGTGAWEGEPAHQFGLSDDDYQAVLARIEGS